MSGAWLIFILIAILVFKKQIFGSIVYVIKKIKQKKQAKKDEKK